MDVGRQDDWSGSSRSMQRSRIVASGAPEHQHRICYVTPSASRHVWECPDTICAGMSTTCRNGTPTYPCGETTAAVLQPLADKAGYSARRQMDDLHINPPRTHPDSVTSLSENCALPE